MYDYYHLLVRDYLGTYNLHRHELLGLANKKKKKKKIPPAHSHISSLTKALLTIRR